LLRQLANLSGLSGILPTMKQLDAICEAADCLACGITIGVLESPKTTASNTTSKRASTTNACKIARSPVEKAHA